MYLGDFAVGATLDHYFTTRRFTTGAPFTLAGTPVISAYEDNGTTEITAGITLTADFDARTGLNQVRVVASGANGFEAGKSYYLVITTGTVDSVSVVGEVIGSFTLERGAAFGRLGAPAGASVSADILAIDNLVDDLESRLGTPTDFGSGTSTIAANLQDLADDGTAVYDRATDSLQAIRDRGDAAWTTVAAAAIRSAVGLTAANLDTQLSAIDDFLDTEIAAILEDTGTTLDDLVDDLEGRLTAALATALQAHGLGIGRGVTAAGSTTTAVVFDTVNDAAASATDDFYNGRHIVFTSGALTLQATSITDYVGATKTATVPALTGAPATAVTFIIV